MESTYPITEFLQYFDNPLIVYLMKAITFLGDEAFYILVLPVVVWCWRKQDGIPIAALMFGTLVLNTLLKNAFSIPRPPESYHLVAATGFGFPSGHAQGAMALWGYLGCRTKKFLPAGIIIFLIGFSRVYLGVHSLPDVLGGWTIGFFTLVPALWLAGRFETGKTTLAVMPAIGLTLIGAATGAALVPEAFIWKISGLVSGAIAGLILERHLVGFTERAPLKTQALKIIVGIGGSLIVKEGLKIAFPEAELWDVLRYVSLGLWIGIGAPWVFRQMGQRGRTA